MEQQAHTMHDAHVQAFQAIAMDDAPRSMAKTMQQARARYVDAVASSGRLSLHNGDDVASLLAGATPETVMRAAETLKELEPGTLFDRYEKLNPGQKRMNAGNQIRSLFKKGEIDLDRLKDAIEACAD